MSNVELPSATDRRLKPEDFRSDAFRRHALDRERAEDEINVGGSVNLQKLEEQLARGRLNEIAALIVPDRHPAECEGPSFRSRRSASCLRHPCCSPSISPTNLHLR